MFYMDIGTRTRRLSQCRQISLFPVIMTIQVKPWAYQGPGLTLLLCIQHRLWQMKRTTRHRTRIHRQASYYRPASKEPSITSRAGTCVTPTSLKDKPTPICWKPDITSSENHHQTPLHLSLMHETRKSNWTSLYFHHGTGGRHAIYSNTTITTSMMTPSRYKKRTSSLQLRCSPKTRRASLKPRTRR